MCVVVFGVSLCYAPRLAGQTREIVTGLGVGVGVSLDVVSITSVKRADGSAVYLAKVLCGTVEHDPSIPQIPASSDPETLVPGTYLSKVNILNPQETNVTVSTGVPSVPQLSLPPLGSFTIVCGLLFPPPPNNFSFLSPFQEFALPIVASKEINVTAVYTVKNVVIKKETTLIDP